MADYGLKVKNSYDGIQIDSTYKNYTVEEVGTKSFNTTTSSQFTVDLVDVDNTPIFAIQPITASYLAIWRWVMSGSSYSGIELVAQASKSSSFNWVLFTEDSANAIPIYGLVVRNNQGNVVFTSGEQYFKIESVTDLSYDYTSYQDVTVVDADNYFILVPHLPWIETATIYWPGILKLTSSSVRIKHFSPGSGTGPNLSGSTYTGVLIEVSF